MRCICNKRSLRPGDVSMTDLDQLCESEALRETPKMSVSSDRLYNDKASKLTVALPRSRKRVQTITRHYRTKELSSAASPSALLVIPQSGQCDFDSPQRRTKRRFIPKMRDVQRPYVVIRVSTTPGSHLPFLYASTIRN